MPPNYLAKCQPETIIIWWTVIQLWILRISASFIYINIQIYSNKGSTVSQISVFSPPHPGCCSPVWLWSRPACLLGPRPGTGTRSPTWSAAARSSASCRCTRCRSGRPWCWLAGARPPLGSWRERVPPSCPCTGRGSDLSARRTSASTGAYLRRHAAETGHEKAKWRELNFKCSYCLHRNT